MRDLLFLFKHYLRIYRRHFFVAGVLFGSLLAAVAADRLVGAFAPPSWRAERALMAGDLVAAEKIYWRMFGNGVVDVPALLDFLSVHVGLTDIAADEEFSELGMTPPLTAMESSVSDAEVEAFLASGDLPEGAAISASYWWDVLRGQVNGEQRANLVEASAMGVPWTNHVLGLEAWGRGETVDAARFFEREGLRPGGPFDDLESALTLLLAAGQTEEVASRVADPHWEAAVPSGLRAQLAFEQQRWGAWLGWTWPAAYMRGIAPAWALAALSACLWGWFCWRLGGPSGMLVAAFGLGIISIYPTHLLIHLEDLIPVLAETGDLVGDAVYFVLGVGLREELAKLLCFLPLLHWLRRGTAPGEGLILGAAVGLGFAFIENVSYFEHGGLGAAMTRFLTANFLHMSLTAIAAETLTQAVRERTDSAVARAVNTFGLVVLLHGAYDWFLVTPGMAQYSILAMTTFVVSSQFFLRAVPKARCRPGLPLDQVVTRALVVLTGATFVYGAAIAGPQAAAVASAQGVLGVVLILVMFNRELG